MTEDIKRFTTEQAAEMIKAAGEQPVRYIHGSAEVYRKVLEENPEAVDIRVSVAELVTADSYRHKEDGTLCALVQAYDADGKPMGMALNNPLPCPPFCG